MDEEKNKSMNELKIHDFFSLNRELGALQMEIV